MKYTKYIIGVLIGVLILSSVSASASTLQGYQGGTGISTATSSDVGKVLTVSSSTPYLTYTLSVATGGFTTSTLAGLQDIVWQLQSGNNLLSITTSTLPSTITLTVTTTPTFSSLNVSATTTLNGVVIAGTGYTPYPEYTFGPDTNTGLDSSAPDVMNLVNGGTNTITMTSSNRVGIGTSTPATKLVVNGTSTVAGNSIVSGQMTISSLGTGLVKSTAGALGNATSGTDYQAPITFPLSYASTTPPTILGGTGISVSTANGTSTITNTGVTSLTASSSIGLSSATGTVNIGAKGYPIQALFQYSTSTTYWDDVIFIPRATSTITNVACVNKNPSDSVTLNFFYGASANTATSSAFKLFSSDQTITSTSTPTILTINASSTPSNNQPLRMAVYNASSTTHCTLNYYEN